MGFWLRKDSVVYSQNYALDDLIVGSNQKDDAGGTDRDKRMWFNKTKGAFRAGEVTGTQWDDANVGTNSIALGLNSTASGTNSVAMANGTASGASAAAIGGTASGINALALGGSATASATGSFVAGGNGSTASGTYSFASGEAATASGRGSRAWGPGATVGRYGQRGEAGAEGEVQRNLFLMADTTTNATPVVMLFDDGFQTGNTVTLTGTNTNVLTLPVSRAHRFTLSVIARRTDTPGTFAGWSIQGTVVRSSSGDARFVGTPLVIAADKDAGAITWDVGVSINNGDATNNYLAVTITGETGATIQWAADLTTVERLV